MAASMMQLLNLMSCLLSASITTWNKMQGSSYTSVMRNVWCSRHRHKNMLSSEMPWYIQYIDVQTTGNLRTQYLNSFFLLILQSMHALCFFKATKMLAEDWDILFSEPKPRCTICNCRNYKDALDRAGKMRNQSGNTAQSKVLTRS